MRRSKEERENMLMNGSLPRTVTQMAIPCIVSFLITSIYSLADTYFVSSLGTQATAAVSVNSSIDLFISMGGTLLAIGAGSLISRLLGAGQKDRAASVLSTSFFLALAFGFLITVVGFAFMRPIIRLLGATPSCEQYSIDYATYIYLVAPILAGSFVMNQGLRSEGSAMLSTIGMGIGGIINCILDPIFIFGLDLGVAGASIATAISKFISFCILLFPYIKKSSLIPLTIKKFKADLKMIWEIITVGSASLFRTGMSMLCAIVMNNLAGRISDSVLAAMGVTNRLMMFPFGLILGFSQGFQPVAGFNWGAKRYDRVTEAYRFSVKVSVLGGIVLAVIVGALAEPLILLFTENDPEMMRVGALTIRLQCIVLPIHAWGCVVNMMSVALGNAFHNILLCTARNGTCYFPVIFPLYYLFAENGLAATVAVADVLTIVLIIPIVKSTFRQIKKAREAHEAELMAASQ